MNVDISLVYVALTVALALYAVYGTSVYRKMSNNVEELKLELAKANFRVFLLEKKEKIFKEKG